MRGLWLVLGCAVGACGPAAATHVSVPPPAPAPAACTPPSDREAPLVIDLPAQTRTDLEAAMSKGVAVVTYDCHGLRVLPDCHVDGRYAFVGVTEKEDVLRLASAADVAANLSAAAQPPVELTLAMVGEKVASRPGVTLDKATGECRGATHFVHAATVGAFSLRSPQKTAGDGSLDACRSATAGADAPPAQCGAALRLDLRAIGEVKVSLADEPRCRKPLVTLDNGQCGDPASTLPHMCQPDELDDCRVQCDRGSMASCAILGRSYQLGRGVQLDVGRAKELLAKACQGGSSQGCGRLGEIAIVEKNAEQAGKLLERSCAMGWLEACNILGGLLAQTPGGASGNAFTLLKRACDGGDPEGCWTLGKLFEAGLGVHQNDAEALKLYELACDGGARRGCLTLSTFVEKGRGGIAPDPARAIALLQSSCDRGFSDACGFLSLHYFDGKGVPRDPKKAIELLERACKGDDLGSCLPLAMRYQNGVGVAKDEARAHQLYTRACDGGLALACEQIRKK